MKNSKKSTPAKPSAFAVWLRQPMTAYLIAGVLAAAAFVQTHSYGFLYDDTRYIEDNRQVHELGNLFDGFGTTFPPYLYRYSMYRPLFTTTLTLDYAMANPIGGRRAGIGEYQVSARPFHITNIVMHVAATLLVVAMAQTLLTGAGKRSKISEGEREKAEKDSPIGSIVPLLTGCLFAVHPAHVEAVANITGRAEVQMGLFNIAAVLFFWKIDPRTPWRKSYWLWAAVAAYFLSIFTKESGITFLVVAAGLVWMRPGFEELEEGEKAPTWTERWALLLPIVAVMVLYLTARLWATKTVGTSELNSYFPFKPELSLWPAMSFIFFLYNVLFFLPTHLYMSYDFPIHLFHKVQVDPIDSWANPWALLGLAFLVVWLVGFAVAVWKRSVWGLALGLTLGSLTIYSQVVPFGDLAAERFLYLPSVGVCLLIALAIERGIRSPRTRMAVASVIIVLFLARTWTQNRVWSSQEAFFGAMAKGAPTSPEAYYGAAQKMLQRGNAARMDAKRLLAENGQPAAPRARELEAEAQEEFRKAVVQMNKALEIDPEFAEVRESLSNVWLEIKPPDIAETIRQYEWFRENGFYRLVNPIAMWGRMARVELARLNYPRALKFINASKRRYTGNLGEKPQSYDEFTANVYSRWAIEIFEDGQHAPAIRMMRQAIAYENNPKYVANLAKMYEDAGDLANAEAVWLSLVQRQPSNALFRQSAARVNALRREALQAESKASSATASDDATTSTAPSLPPDQADSPTLP